jgi:SAM-dependent methyltransferase
MNFIGAVDNVRNGKVSGWAINREAPDFPCVIDIYVRGQLIKSSVATSNRPDLASLGANTNHGFEIALPAELANTPYANIKVRFGGTQIDIPASNKFKQRLPIDFDAILQVGPSPWVAVPPSNIISYTSGNANRETQVRSYLLSGIINTADIINVCLAHNLKPRDPGFRIIDIGCGAGRYASFLPQFAPDCSYLGLDVQQHCIDWATSNISSRFPNMTFHALSNGDHYDGSKAYEIPAPPGSADLIMATSLFTHLDETAFLGYLQQISEILKPDGLGFLTFFLLDQISEAGASTRCNESGMDVTKTNEAWWFGKNGYLDIYYREPPVRRMIESSGLRLLKIRRGFWSDNKLRTKEEPAAYQDLLLVTR